MNRKRPIVGRSTAKSSAGVPTGRRFKERLRDDRAHQNHLILAVLVGSDLAGRWLLLQTSLCLAAGAATLLGASLLYGGSRRFALRASTVSLSCFGSVSLGLCGGISINNALALSAGYVLDLLVWWSHCYLTVGSEPDEEAPQRIERYIVVAGLLLAVLPFATSGSARLKGGFRQSIRIAWICPVPPPDMTLELVVLTGHDYGPIELPGKRFNVKVQQAALSAETRGKQTYLSIVGGEPLSTFPQPPIVGPNTYLLWRYLMSGLAAEPFSGVEMRNSPSVAATAVLTLGHSLGQVLHITDLPFDCAEAKRLSAYGQTAQGPP